VVVGARPGEGSSPNRREARRHLVFRVQLQQPLGVLKLGGAPGLRSAGAARPIPAPLGIVVPEEDQRRHAAVVLGHGACLGLGSYRTAEAPASPAKSEGRAPTPASHRIRMVADSRPAICWSVPS